MRRIRVGMRAIGWKCKCRESARECGESRWKCKKMGNQDVDAGYQGGN